MKVMETKSCYGWLLAVVGCLVLTARSDCAPGKVEWVRTISSEKDRYCGWPSVCDISGGELAVVFSGDRNAHVCPWGKVRMVRSKDGGETWSESTTLCNSVLDDRDAGLLRLANEELVMFWFTSIHFYENGRCRKNNPDYARHFEKLDKSAVYRDLGSFSRRSTDGGLTWEPPVRLPTTAPHGGIQLPDGRMVVVGNQYSDTRGHMQTDPEEKEFAKKDSDLVVAESSDMGRSWRELARIPRRSGACEPHLTLAADGALRCYVRTSRNLVFCESRDGGHTWSQLVDTAIPSWDNPPHLLRLKDGCVLLTYGRRVYDAKNDAGMKTGVFARIGDANATPASFEAAAEVPIYLSGNVDLGYASTVEISDGTLLTVFYAHEKPAASILAAKWRR